MSVSPLTIFTGCAAALVTPFLPDGSIDQTALQRLIAMQLEAGANAVVLLGTTGEPSTLSMEEREVVIRTGIESVGKKIPVIVGTGSNDTKKAIEYARQAYDLGADAQLSVTPYYNKTTQTGLIRHFSAIMDSCLLPLIAYNVPGRTGMELLPETVRMLAVHPNLAGIKEASGNTERTAAMMETTCGTVPIYCGCDELITPLMAIGAEGAISVCANIIPSQTVSMINACQKGDFCKARHLQHQFMPLIRMLFAQTNPIPVKAALSMLGIIYDELRLPLIPLEEPYRKKLSEILLQLNLIPGTICKTT